MAQEILHSRILGEGKPFLILHGYFGMSDNWKTLGNRFAEHFQVHLIDLRNHGRSFHAREFNYDLMVDDVQQYIEYHQLEDCILLGHSMGGKTAMLFTALYPDLIHKLIVVDIAPRFYPAHHDAILEGLSSLDFSIISSRKQADQKLSEYIAEVGVRQFLLKNLYWITPGQLGLRINLEALKNNVAEVGEALPTHLKIERTTLFLRGDRSEYIGPDDEKQISIQFPNAILKTIPKAGHWLHAENPEAFFDEVAQFLA